MMKTSDAQISAVHKYNEKNTVSVMLRLNKKTDADIIQQLENVPSKMGYIKNLIRADIHTK